MVDLGSKTKYSGWINNRNPIDIINKRGLLCVESVVANTLSEFIPRIL